MKNQIVFWLFLGFLQTAFSQIITVKDIHTKENLEKVTFMTENPILSSTTNSKGEVDLSQFKGKQGIEVRKTGYKSILLNYNDISSDKFEVFLESAPMQMDQVVVVAARWNQSMKYVPSKISTIAPKTVALWNPQTAADLLGISGEVFIQKSQQGGGSPMIRGFATNRLLYTVDGIRMNSAIFRSGNIQNVISLDAFAIENTEIFFGPGSIIYGSDAIGGVMSFQTLTPQLSVNNKRLLTGKFVSRYSTVNNEITNHIDIGIAGKKWSSISSFTQTNYGSLRMGKYGPSEYLKTFYVDRKNNKDTVIENSNPRVQNPSGYSQMNIMQKFRFKADRYWDFQYGFYYSKTSNFSRYDRLIETQASGLPVSAIWNYGPQVWTMNNLSITHTKLNVLYDGMSIRLAHQYFEESRIDRRFNHHRLRTQIENVDAISGNIDFEKSHKNQKIFYGIEYVFNRVKSLANAVDIGNGAAILVPSRYPNSDWKSYAAYLNYQYFFGEKFQILGGIRYNGINIKSDFSSLLSFYPFDFISTTLENSATTGSLGLVYRPTEKWKIGFSGSTGFRAPNVDDMGKLFDFSPGEVMVPNTNLEPEYAYNLELNIVKIIGKTLKIDASVFYTYLNQSMVRRAYTVNGKDSLVYDGVLSKVYAIQNAAFGQVYGLSAGFEWLFFSGLSLNGKYNYQVGTEEMNSGVISPSRHAAPAFGLLSLTYTRDKMVLQFYGQISAGVEFDNLNEEERLKPFIYAKDANGNPYSPSWYTLNLKSNFKLSKHVVVSCGVENILDQRYRPYSSGLVAGGRNVSVSLKANL